jgi:hypothetical protein
LQIAHESPPCEHAELYFFDASGLVQSGASEIKQLPEKLFCNVENQMGRKAALSTPFDFFFN